MPSITAPPFLSGDFYQPGRIVFNAEDVPQPGYGIRRLIVDLLLAESITSISLRAPLV